MTTGNLEVSKGPTYSIVKKLLDSAEDCSGCVFGEEMKFPHLKKEYGFEVVDIKIVEMPSEDDDEYDSEIYNDFQTKAEVRIMADCSMYKLESADLDSAVLKENLRKWLITRQDGEEFDNDQIYFGGDYEILDKPIFDGKKELKFGILFDPYDLNISAENIISSPFYDQFWDPIMNAVITEGVCYSNEKVTANLRDSIRRNLDKLAAETSIDYHPNSNDIVRDLVHPALFSYVDGVSKFKSGKSKDDFVLDGVAESFDFWKRKNEKSIYQWLPTPFKISSNGECTIKEYVNNLQREKFPELYGDLEKLFELFLPCFEEVWSYAKAMVFWDDKISEDEADDMNRKDEIDFEKIPVDFKGQDLQVITKIVEYKLKPGQTYEGVWHVEGMSHENIVMSGIYFIDRDPDLQGGDLRYKRAFHLDERNYLFGNIPQCRSILVNDLADKGILPLGHFPTEEGYMLVFPNCHVHKIAKLFNKSETKDACRRIIVFFVVNPEKNIISTAEIAPQQNTVMSLKDAQQHRLNLMTERKYDKENYNTRNIELCEH